MTKFIGKSLFVVKNKLSDLNYVITDNTGTTLTVYINNLKPCLDQVIEAKNIRKRAGPKKK